MDRIAECCCGQCTVKVKANPLVHIVCNCNNCKKRTGSAFGVSAYFGSEQVLTQTGTTKTYRIDSEGYYQERFFCDTCGTTLYWTISVYPNVIGIAAGCFIRQPLCKPAIVANKHQQSYWFDLKGDWAESFDPNILALHQSVG